MDGRRWYPQQHVDYRHNDPAADRPNARYAADSVQDAHGLLSMYPMASATPTTHVARHLSHMTITAAPPSFVQPSYYNTPGPSYPSGNPPPYTEYAPELAYLGARQMPRDDSGYWETARDNAVRYLGDQGGGYAASAPWPPQGIPSSVSSYESGAFAQTIFQRTYASSSYHTPPPGITMASSSIAHALGSPILRPPRTVYQPEQSASFFNEFLVQKTAEIIPLPPPPPVDPRPRATPTSNRQVQQVQREPPESPDPLALRPATPKRASFAAMATPRKRKPDLVLESPSVKRIQSDATPVTPRSSTAPVTPTKTVKSGKPAPKRVITLDYIEIVPKPWLTPSSSQRGSSSKPQRDAADDLGGYGSDEDSAYSPRKRSDDTVKSSARRTGDRDERAPLEKLIALFEDTFEAEDALPPDVDVADLSPEFFSLLTVDISHPMLSSNIIRKLTKYICQVARPSKRLRHGVAGAANTPRVKGRMAEVDTAVLSRLLKMLERSVKSGEDLDPFVPLVFAPVREKTSSPRKPKKKKANDRRSKTPKGDDQDHEMELIDAPLEVQQAELTDADFERLTKILELARDSILAADCCIALLSSDRLTKQLYSEELITACLGTIKNQLTKIVYPFVEASAEISNTMHPLLQHVVKANSTTSQTHRRLLSETFQALSAVLPRINNLVSAEMVAMSDSIIIQAVYIAIGPFFVVESGGDSDSKGKKDNVVLRTLGKSAMRGLRLDALSLIRSIFANHEEQRSWIIEEILTSLIKLSDTKQRAGQFQLRDGRSIRTVSALLLQLVQTSAHDVRMDAKKIEKSRQQSFALRRQESINEKDPTPEPFLDDNDKQEITLYLSGLDSATKAAKTIIIFLTQRSGKGKATKNANEAEYRTIFDNLISDLLAVLYWPEWPAASLLLSIACKFMVTSLDDVKNTTQTDNNAAKTIALDHLGVIAARIRSSTLKIRSMSETDPKLKGLRPMEEITASVDFKAFEILFSTHRDVAWHLCKRSSEDQAYDSARELTAATLGQELAISLKQLDFRISEQDDDDLNLKSKEGNLVSIGRKIKTALRDVWKDQVADVFDIGTQEEVARIDRLAEAIGTIQGLRSSFHPILNVILLALDAPPIFMRTKALRALGQIVTSDPDILSAPNVRRAIEAHLLDSSPAVRDAAVELIGKYMIDSPDVATEYYQKIADRIADTGLSVRKRVIKLLKSFYNVTEDTNRRIDISTRLVLRMLDEDDTVKELAIKAIEELWFPNTAPSSSQKPRSATLPISSDSNGSLLSKVAVIMGVSANFKDRQSPLEDMLHKIMADKEGAEALSLHARYAEICETLIDGLVDASDLPGFSVINCVRTIHLFAAAYPAILSGSKASTLLPYLKNATTVEEQATSDYLLKIFRASVPHMPKTAIKFGQELQLALQPMIIKPATAGGVQALQETVACMCIVVQNLTHDFTRLVALVKSCNGRLQQAIKKPDSQAMTPNEVKALSILIFIVSLLGEHCDFDSIRSENNTIASELDSISSGSIVEHIYNSLLRLYEKYDNAGLRGRILQCLGFLFRAQPTLMTLESSAVIMDAIFAAPEEEPRGRLLKIMQDFLISEAAKHSAREKENAKGQSKGTDVNMEELVGNTDGFADSGVSSAVVQRYLSPILDAALSQHMQIQAPAIDVLSFTVKQGLAHPLQSFPVIVALETSPNNTLSTRANALHAILHSKHTSLLNTRYSISARASFDYQKKLCTGPVQGFRMQPGPTALLQRWYSLVREKRPARQDFLKALVKVFEVNLNLASSQDDIDFTRYMAENFSAFDYKSQEEVLTVLKYLTSVLSTAGMQLVEVLSPSHLLAQLREPLSMGLQPVVPAAGPDVMDISPPHIDNLNNSLSMEKMPIMRSSVVIGMIMLLKAYLKALYGISEDKCSKFVLGKKSAIGDRPAVKRHADAITWDRLPYATKPLLTTQDMNEQKARFLDVWNEDGLAAEPEDDMI